MLETHEQQTFIRMARNIINCEVFAHLEPKDRPVIFAIPNGGSRHKLEAVNLKLGGVLAGIPDICFTYANGKYHGLFIEMKRPKGEQSRTKPNQQQVIENLTKYGYSVHVCKGWQEAEKVFREYIAQGGKS